MNTAIVGTRRLSVLALLVFAPFVTSSAFACVVGTGTSARCAEAALDACLPGGSSFNGTVTFNCGGAATITVTSQKTISADTTIDGGSLITISGGNTVGVFSVSAGVTFTVQNLTIVNGNSASYQGGGIDNHGTLTVTNSTFSGNNAGPMPGLIPAGGSGGGIYNDGGVVTVTNSTFSGNDAGGGAGGGTGGGIYNNGGIVTVTNSTFSGNGAVEGNGGGIYNGGGSVAVTNSTFSGNSAADGGGIFNGGTLMVSNSTISGNCATDDNGGGIWNGRTVTVSNSTVSGNSANAGYGGGIYNPGGTLTIISSTVSGNSAGTESGDPYYAYGGGIYNGGTAMLTNTIVANNSAGKNCGVSCTPNDLSFNCASVIDGGHNIADDDSCGFAGTSLSEMNALLDPAGLANNGGPTQTIALLTGSPAINAGDETVCSAPPVNNRDQRGYVRPGSGATQCSIGAYEFACPGPCPSTTTTPSTSSTTTTSTTSLSTTTTSRPSRITTSTVIPISTTTTTGATSSLPPATTTTTLSCMTARCTLAAALMSPACAGQTIPASVTSKLSRAESLIDQAATTPGKTARKVRQRARNLLKQAGAKATRAAKGKKPKITPACAAALKDAAGRVAAGL